ncbi:MAG: TonB-dependent receptor [Bacteroidales bacterium]|nr:TonB-dependent receptor [Bacteroidales bacterium]
MYKHTQQHASVFRFRRFCRAKWAAYSSMHREVTIGRLATRVADSSLAKTATVGAVALMLMQGTAFAQSDREPQTRTLPEVQIVLSADSLQGSSEPAAVLTANDFQQTNIRSIGDLVALLPGVDLRTRGGGDVQGDLSMRGGTFDQMLLLLNGINLTDAQTGHHTMDIPLDITIVERVELLTPAQLMARGIVGFCGAVNIVVADQYRDRLLADLSGGSYGTANAALLGTKTLGDWTLTASAAYHRSDGYRENTDYRHGSLFLQVRRHTEGNDLHLQLGGQMKDFGSAGFYSTTYPDQYEATRTLVASATDNFHLSTFHFQLSAYGRLHRDRFELFRDGYVDSVPTWYSGHNHHLSSLGGLRLRMTHPLGIGELRAGAEVRREGIWSNVLGTADSTLPSPYTMSAARTSATLFGGYGLSRGRFSAEAVALGQANTQFGPNYGLAASIGFPLSTFHFQLSASRTFRLPTFTDLYYQSATQQANPDLNAESSTNVELSVVSGQWPVGKFSILNFQLSTYYRSGTDIIGWVRPTEADLWLSMNHTSVDALGFDVSALFQLPTFNCQLSYSFCHIEADNRGLLSSSAIDHLSHKAQLWAMAHVTDHLRLKAGASLRHREGQYVEDGETLPYGTALLVDAAAEYDLLRQDNGTPTLTLYVEGHNLLDRPWRDLGGVPQPGLTLLAGARLAL